MMKPQPAIRIRGLVEHAARQTGLPASDRALLTTAIMERLALTPWADVPLRAAPDVICRRARLAAAAVHQPDLLLADGLLDNLVPREVAALADAKSKPDKLPAAVAAEQAAYEALLKTIPREFRISRSRNGRQGGGQCGYGSGGSGRGGGGCSGSIGQAGAGSGKTAEG